MPTEVTYRSCPCDRPTCAGADAIASIGCIFCPSYSHRNDQHDQYVDDHSLTCGVCGESFVPETPDEPVCQSCFREAHRG